MTPTPLATNNRHTTQTAPPQNIKKKPQQNCTALNNRNAHSNGEA